MIGLSLRFFQTAPTAQVRPPPGGIHLDRLKTSKARRLALFGRVTEPSKGWKQLFDASQRLQRHAKDMKRPALMSFPTLQKRQRKRSSVRDGLHAHGFRDEVRPRTTSCHERDSAHVHDGGIVEDQRDRQADARQGLSSQQFL